MKLFKIIFLQIYWYLVVYWGQSYEFTFFVITLILLALNYTYYNPQVSLKKYITLILVFSSYGFFQDGILSFVGWVNYPDGGHFPFWLNSLWIIFLAYYGDVLNYMVQKSILIHIVLGAVGGFFAFYGGVKIAQVEVVEPLWYFMAITFSWAFFFPMSMKIFYKNFSMNQCEGK